jgi:phosphate transport system substrate-binding protein
MDANRGRSLVITVLVIIAIIAGYYSFAHKTAETVHSTINQKGSDTLLVLAQRWAEEYMKKNPDVRIAVSGGGSGAGIAALINGQIDIADASREIKQIEIDEAKARGIDPVEWKVAIDGISVIIHPSNPINELTIEQLSAIYRGEIKNWKELGGPDLWIVTYGRQSNSGTYVYWKEHVLGNKDYRADMQSLNGNSDIVDAVSRDKAAIGYVGIAYAESRRDEVKILAVKKDAGSPAVLPSQETIVDGSYPIARYLYFYTNGVPKGALAEYLRWVIGPEGQAIVPEVGYIPLPRSVAEEQLKKIG